MIEDLDYCIVRTIETEEGTTGLQFIWPGESSAASVQGIVEGEEHLRALARLLIAVLKVQEVPAQPVDTEPPFA